MDPHNGRCALSFKGPENGVVTVSGQPDSVVVSIASADGASTVALLGRRQAWELGLHMMQLASRPGESVQPLAYQQIVREAFIETKIRQLIMLGVAMAWGLFAFWLLM